MIIDIKKRTLSVSPTSIEFPFTHEEVETNFAIINLSEKGDNGFIIYGNNEAIFMTIFNITGSTITLKDEIGPGMDIEELQKYAYGRTGLILPSFVI